uniref:Transcription factor-like protein DPB n=1 Tax=Chenopodium quinoa TaxID=63459 RepID=A0A803MFY4_CHEQI
MVTGNSQEDREKNPKGATRSWGPAVSGQSVSTSGSVGSPSSRSEAGMATPARDSTVLRLSHLEIHGDDSASQGAVADELVAEYADASNALGSNENQGYDEKNIRRRVYDALNVLMAMDIISKDKKEIQWRGLPRTSLNDIEELKTERVGLRNRIEKKAAYLRELEEQFVGYQNLIQRNQQLYGDGNAPTGGVALPFILVQTRPNATVEVEISEDMQLVHFDFNSTPFELHDDNYVLKQMNVSNKSLFDAEACDIPANAGEGPSVPATTYHPQISQPPSPKTYHNESSQLPSPPKPYQPQTCTSPSSSTQQAQMTLPSSRPNTAMKSPTSPPLPGILKARVQHDR